MRGVPGAWPVHTGYLYTVSYGSVCLTCRKSLPGELMLTFVGAPAGGARPLGPSQSSCLQWIQYSTYVIAGVGKLHLWTKPGPPWATTDHASLRTACGCSHNAKAELSSCNIDCGLQGSMALYRKSLPALVVRAEQCLAHSRCSVSIRD